MAEGEAGEEDQGAEGVYGACDVVQDGVEEKHRLEEDDLHEDAGRWVRALSERHDERSARCRGGRERALGSEGRRGVRGRKIHDVASARSGCREC